MSYSLKTSQKADHIHFLVTGENSPQTLASMFSECLAICQSTNRRVALVEDALTGPDLELDVLFELIGGVSVAARKIMDLVCYVKTTPSHDRAIVRFAENIASNRNLNVRVFKEVADAEAFIHAWVSGHH